MPFGDNGLLSQINLFFVSKFLQSKQKMVTKEDETVSITLLALLYLL